MNQSERDKKVNAYVKAVKQNLRKEYGRIPAEFEPQLQQLSDVYDTYLKAASKFREVEDPITFINQGKTPMVNIQFSLMRDCIRLMETLVKNFGLSPLAELKFKKDKPAGDESPDYLDTL